MAKPKTHEYTVSLSFKLHDKDGRRWDEIVDRAHKADRKANKTDVIRALLRLPPDKPSKPELLTEEDRRYFSDTDAPSVSYIKLVGRVSAGKIIESVEDVEMIPVLSIDIEGTKKPRALRIIGDSMMDANVMDGDIILVGDCADPRNRVVVAYIIEHGTMKATLKRWRQKGQSVTLEPANPKYKSEVYPAKKLKWYGMLIKVLRTVELPDAAEKENDAAA